jgi:hypothetical protein
MIRPSLKIAAATIVFITALAPMLRAQDDDDDDRDGAKRVLLLSVDGLHAGDLERFVRTHPDSALAWLSAHGRTYTQATATLPSDSFPGLLAMVTGGTPRSTGVYYDDGYDRSLAAATGACVAGARVQWKQTLDVLPFSFTTTIDPSKLPRDPADLCTTRVYPHQFPRVNNVFELVKAAGGRTAWSDKHPAYEFLDGPSGTGVDDLYTPEITVAAGIATTNSFALTMAYDDMKVAAIVNEIRGFDHAGINSVGVPTVFGMNFQAVSVGQKLNVEQVATAPPLTGGYLDAAGTPADGLQATLDHTDGSIAAMLSALNEQELLESTLIIVSAKHGNSPIDPATLVRVNPSVISTIVNSVAPGLALLSADTGPLIWLKDQSTTEDVVAALTESMTNGGNPARIASILAGEDLRRPFPDWPSQRYEANDSRRPDIILIPILGTVYTTSATKIADHGGSSEDDVHVALLVANASMTAKTIGDAVETRQIACTILKTLDIDCGGLMSEEIERSKFLPHSNHKDAILK